MEGAASLLQERRDFARQRAAVIAADASLQERELLKLATLGVAAAEALRRRGVQTRWPAWLPRPVSRSSRSRSKDGSGMGRLGIWGGASVRRSTSSRC